MNEYRVPELNVQNGVLKALSFLFEYIGEMGKDYIYAVTPLFEDALQERDLVHRQVCCLYLEIWWFLARDIKMKIVALNLLYNFC